MPIVDGIMDQPIFREMRMGHTLLKYKWVFYLVIICSLKVSAKGSENLCDSSDLTAGDLTTCYNQAVHLERGTAGVSQDYRAAEKIYLKVCSSSKAITEVRASACVNYGGLYHSAMGVPRDFDIATKYYELSCDLGLPEGCWRAGLLINGVAHLMKSVRSNQVLVTRKRGAEILQKSCEDGFAKSCTSLAGIYFQGQGVPQSQEVAVHLFKKGCALGDFDACAVLK